MARAGIIVEQWVVSLGWQYSKSFLRQQKLAALAHAKALESKRIPARVTKLTPEGPKVVYESSHA